MLWDSLWHLKENQPRSQTLGTTTPASGCAQWDPIPPQSKGSSRTPPFSCVWDPIPPQSTGTPPFTCVVTVVVGVSQAPQPCVSLVELGATVVAELSSRVRVALASFDAFPPAGLVFVIRVILFVLHPEALGFLHKGTLLVLAQQTAFGCFSKRERKNKK